jgi:FlaA1/EpsC-like NDP-sugar epimerase
MYIGNVRVLGPLTLLYDLLEDNVIDEVIVAMPDASGDAIREYVLECRKHKVPVKVVPRFRDLLNGRPNIQLEEFSVEDLLRRPPVCTDMSGVASFMMGKRVLVTGAGGSIGSELCRQILALKPHSLVLLGHGENSIFQIYNELRRDFPQLCDRISWVIASVSDERRINQVFSRVKPHVVFHAAAHKHVPIMESNILEAANNNVLGTNNLAEACGRYGVGHMVLISTDKAANPASVMGASKWLCEEVVRAASATWPDTTYVTVRFGNVLGSRGSVVPLFREQIKRGGPVTVTHPEMTRYFMTIPEASQLVLHAAAIGSSGELYLLDMGNPVKILELAHDMIRLCGYEPDIDIAVEFTGIRPGEKLHEQLVTESAEIRPAACVGLSVVHRNGHLSQTQVLDMLERLNELLDDGDEMQMREYLKEIVPGFADIACHQNPKKRSQVP